MFGNISSSDIPRELLSLLNGMTGSLEDDAKIAVNMGLTNCPCGKPNCKFGKAIRAEVKRRETTDGKAPSDLATMFVQALPAIQDALTQAQVDAYRRIRKEEHDRALTTRLGHFVWLLVKTIVSIPISLLLLVILLIIKSLKYAFYFSTGALKWRDLLIEDKLEEGLANDLGQLLYKATIPVGVRHGARFGKWTNGRWIGLTTRLRQAGSAISVRVRKTSS